MRSSYVDTIQLCGHRPEPDSTLLARFLSSGAMYSARLAFYLQWGAHREQHDRSWTVRSISQHTRSAFEITLMNLTGHCRDIFFEILLKCPEVGQPPALWHTHYYHHGDFHFQFCTQTIDSTIKLLQCCYYARWGGARQSIASALRDMGSVERRLTVIPLPRRSTARFKYCGPATPPRRSLPRCNAKSGWVWHVAHSTDHTSDLAAGPSGWITLWAVADYW